MPVPIDVRNHAFFKSPQSLVESRERIALRNSGWGWGLKVGAVSSTADDDWSWGQVGVKKGAFLFATKSCIVMRTGRPAKQWMGLVIEALALRNQKKASRSKGILGAGESRIRPAKKLFSGGLPMGGQAHAKRVFF